MRNFTFFFFFIAITFSATAQSENSNIAVIGYYAGRPTMVDSFPVEKLTHIIFSFCHLKGDSLSVTNGRDSTTIENIVALKKRNPSLKVMLSLGGWGGCKTCSEVFSTKGGRKNFAKSSRSLNNYFHTDGVDIDWEYPVIEGFPGHPYSLDDKKNFTAMIKQLRKKLGKKNEISFAAGGFTTYIDSSIDWKKVMPMVDRVNLMSYDLISGFSKESGHHTPLYSNDKQTESVDHGVKKLREDGVPPGKIAIGAAFYARLFVVDTTINNGLYLPGKFYHGLPFSHFADSINSNTGFTKYWDSVAQAPYAFNPERRLLATYDDSLSITLKTKYVIKYHLNGVMFWQLAEDKFTGGLLDVIDKVKSQQESATTKN